MVESMVFTLFGLLMRRSSCDGCRGKLSFLYQSNKILLQFSWTHFPVKVRSHQTRMTRIARIKSMQRRERQSAGMARIERFRELRELKNLNFGGYSRICCVVNFMHEWREFLTRTKRVNSKCSSVQLRANSAIYSRHLQSGVNAPLITKNGQANARHWQGTRHSTRPNAISARLHTINKTSVS